MVVLTGITEISIVAGDTWILSTNVCWIFPLVLSYPCVGLRFGQRRKAALARLKYLRSIHAWHYPPTSSSIPRACQGVISPLHSDNQRMDSLTDLLSDLPHLNLEGLIVNKQLHASSFGGTCDVYPAWSTKHGKKVAVKQIRTFMRNDEAFSKVSCSMLGT